MQNSWGFYGRNVETTEVANILSSGRWFFAAISGRRRIGKTRLIQEALKQIPDAREFYFQVPDSDERGVVQAFQDALEDYGRPQAAAREWRNFPDMATAIEQICDSSGIVIIDEFQYFHRKALSPFTSYLQAAVDRMRDTTKGGLIVLGSIHTEMTAILEDRNSPLFNRITHRLNLGHWDFETLFEMFETHGVLDGPQQLFLWTLFEGIPKFYRDCFEQGVLAPRSDYRDYAMRRLFFGGASPLRDEADNWFLRELRGRYDSVLKILAREGPCPYGRLVAEYARAGTEGEKQLTAYLSTLIDRFRMVDKLRPIFAGETNRKARYVISDNFLSVWLRALARNVQMARVQPVEGPISRADEAIQAHEGFAFEKMIRQLTEECSRKGCGDFALTDFVQGYWNKPDGSDIEIDLVAVNEDDRIIRFGSCKRSANKHDTAAFDGHVERFLNTKDGHRFTGWTVQKALYSPVFPDGQRQHLEARGYICRDIPHFRNLLFAKRTSP